MNIKMVRSDSIYRKMMNAPIEKRDDLYRYEMMKPFEFKWTCINVPMKAKQANGYDVIMASEMLGFLPAKKVDISQRQSIDYISDESLWSTCYDTIKTSLNEFTKSGYALEVEEYVFTILLANKDNPYVQMSDGYSGDGGIPGYILASLVPDEFTLERMPVAIAHECNHNVRFQFEKWRNDITLYEMMISEGLAEVFATTMFGEDKLGPWVSKTDLAELEDYIKPIIYEGLDVTGFAEITAYLYGDEIAKLQNYPEVGLPYCAGYACGYYMIKYYLEKTGKSIVEATLTASSDIIKELNGFWT